MKTRFSALILFLFLSVYSQAQCFIGPLNVQVGECNDFGKFYVTISFDHAGTSQRFKVQGNGVNYGLFEYSALPVTIGPLNADCTTQYEFVVRDNEVPTCLAFAETGTKCCQDNCSVQFKDVVVGECNGLNYKLKFDLEHNAPENGFDLYNNGQFYGYYQYSQLPLSLNELPSSNNATYNTIVVCANDNPNCCDTLKVLNPCICTIYNLQARVLDCNEDAGTFSIKFNFKHHLASDSFKIGGNGVTYGTFAYSQLPVTITGLTFSDSLDYEFLIIDKEEPFCFSIYELGKVTECNFECSISDLVATAVNHGVTGFTVRGNGQIYGNFEYGEPYYRIGPLKGDCHTLYEFVVVDKEIETCRTDIHLNSPVCCQPEACTLSDMVITEYCENNQLVAFDLDFNHSGTSGTFFLRINNTVIGTFAYADLPLKVTNLSFGLPVAEIRVFDSANEACRLVKLYEFECYQAPGCNLYDLVVTPSACNDQGKFYARVKFKVTNPQSDQFIIKINGVVFDTLPYGQEVYEVGPLMGDCQTLYHFLVRDIHNGECADDYAFTEPVCCNSAACHLYDLVVTPSACNDQGKFYARVKFKVTNPKSDFFIIKINGVVFDTLPYGQDIYEVGPLNGDCQTIYHFVVRDLHGDCADDYSFTTPVCCNGAACRLYDLVVMPSACNDQGKFYAKVKFKVTNPQSDFFIIKINGVVFDTLPYGQEIYEVGPLMGDCQTLYHFLVRDIHNGDCADDYAFTEPVCCNSAACQLSNPVVTILPCHWIADHPEIRFFDLKINFDHTGNTSLFRIKAAGVVYGPFMYGSLPVVIENLREKTAYEIVIWDTAKEACRLVINIPAIECTSASEDIWKDEFHFTAGRDEIQLKLPAAWLPSKVLITDITGRSLMTKDGAGDIKISTDHLPAGIYVIHVMNGRKAVSRKFVKY